MGFRITTWNVNGIRNPFSYQPWNQTRTFESMFGILEADIVVMQETKIQRKDLRDDMVLVPGWDVYFSLPRHKKGYSGVAIYTRNATCSPIRAEEGITGILPAPKSTTSFRDLPEDQQIGGYPRPGQLSGAVDEALLDSEGRCVMLEFPAFVLMGVYSPANRDESRDDFRLGFLEALDVRVRNLVAMGKQVILTGDLNVIRNEQDSTNMVEQLRKSGVSSEEWLSMPSRRLFNQLIFGGSVCGPRDPGREQPVLWDICRSFHPDREGMNTCWDTRKNTRPANNGSRIDYVLCSDGLKSWFVDANIQEGLMGSDHCPVYGVMGDSVSMICHKGVEGGSGSCSGSDAGKRQHRCEGASLLDVVNPPGMFVGGQRRHEWSQQKHLLPLSAKLIPEFDRRQSIRDMFTRKASTVSSKSGTAGPSAGRQRRASPSTQRDSGDASVTRDGESQDGTEADGKPAAPGSQGTDGQASGPEDPTTTVGATKVSAQTTTTMASSVPVSSSASLQKQPKTKRPLPFGSNSPVKSKRITPAAAAGGPKQKTIQGFFKPSVANTSAAPKADKDKAGDGDQASGIATDRGYPPPAPTATPLSAAVGADAQSSTGAHADPGASSIAQDEDDRVFDPIEAKESWSRLLGRRVVPRCEHDEPCISLVTKKPGINCGTCVPPPANILLSLVAPPFDTTTTPR